MELTPEFIIGPSLYGRPRKRKRTKEIKIDVFEKYFIAAV